MHLFIVPKSMTKRQRNDFVEEMKESLKKPEPAMMVGSDIEYKTLVFDEGEQFSIVRKGDAFEFIKLKKR